ncbi:hypothetical protein D3C76_746370 [compost metagenome]
MAQLNLAGLNPRARLMPELIAIGTVRIIEHVDDAWGILAPIGNPGALFQACPHLLGHRFVNQTLQRCTRQILTLGIEQGANQDVLAIGREVKSQPLAVIARGIASQTTGCRELAHDGGSASLKRFDGRWKLLRLRNRDEQ